MENQLCLENDPMVEWLDELHRYYKPKFHTELSLNHLRMMIDLTFDSEDFKHYESWFRDIYAKKYPLVGQAKSKGMPYKVPEEEDEIRFRNTMVMYVFGLLQFATEYTEQVKQAFKTLYTTTQNVGFRLMQAFVLILVNFLEPEKLNDERFRIAAKLYNSIGFSELAQAAKEHRAKPSYWVDQMYTHVSTSTLYEDIKKLLAEFIAKAEVNRIGYALEKELKKGSTYHPRKLFGAIAKRLDESWDE